MKRQSPPPVRSTGLQGVSLIGAALVVAAAYHPWLAFAGVASVASATIFVLVARSLGNESP